MRADRHPACQKDSASLIRPAKVATTVAGVTGNNIT